MNKMFKLLSFRAKNPSPTINDVGEIDPKVMAMESAGCDGPYENETEESLLALLEDLYTQRRAGKAPVADPNCRSFPCPYENVIKSHLIATQTLEYWKNIATTLGGAQEANLYEQLPLFDPEQRSSTQVSQ